MHVREQVQALEEDVERELKEHVDKLEKEKARLRKRMCSLSDRLRKTSENQPPKRGPSKSFDEHSEGHKQRLKRKRVNSVEESLLWMEKDGLEPVCENSKHGTTETIELGQHGSEQLLGPSEHLTNDDIDTLNMILYVKDRYNVSGNAYHELARLCRGLPRHYTIKKRIEELNKCWIIRPTPNGTAGVQQSLTDRLRVRIEHLLKTSDPEAEFVKKKLVRVKLSGDSTKIGKRLHVVTFTFTILEGSKAHSCDGNHILAVFMSAG